jgi:hypothetical protein
MYSGTNGLVKEGGGRVRGRLRSRLREKGCCSAAVMRCCSLRGARGLRLEVGGRRRIKNEEFRIKSEKVRRVQDGG